MQLSEMTSPGVGELARDVPIVLPIASLEQHSRHLPLMTDSLLLGEVVRRVDRHLGHRVVFAPVLWVGNSHHHLDFPGTVSAEPRTYLDLLSNLIENFIGHGFRRVVLLTGHGGNIVPGQQAVFEVRQKYRERKDLLLVATAYWTLGGQPRDAIPDLRQSRMRHACEWETSMMLRLAPHLVQRYDQLEDIEMEAAFEPAARGWTMLDYSQPGHIGAPREATPGKGEELFEFFAADVTRLLESIIAWRPPPTDGTSAEGTHRM